MRYILGVIIIILASYSDIFLFRMGLLPSSPAYTIIPVFIALSFMTFPLTDILDIFRSHTFKMLALVLIFSLIYTAITRAKLAVILEKVTLNTITIFLYVLCVQFFRTSSSNLSIMVMVSAFFILGGSVVYDMFIGLPKRSLELAMSVRKGGFGENPNQAASGIKFLALAALVFLTDKIKLKYIVIAFMVVSVFLTFSRSGLVSVVFILGLGALNNWDYQFKFTPVTIVQRSVKLVILFVVLFIALVGIGNIVRANFPAFNRGEAGKRLDLLTGNSKTKNVSKQAFEGGREVLLAIYWNEFKKNPLGYGTGYSSDKSANNNKLNTHNYYLYLAVNFGFVALLCYLVYVLYNIRVSIKYDQFYYLIFSILFILEGFFTHSIFYYRPIIVCLAVFDSQVYKTLSESRIKTRLANHLK
ncbi:O-antigen ligase family protein [Winogradskyella sp. DF17]|uniref:O-antigen ligase family protein n=1 Tax=Winogradskyella pelagia TaxID=2819984 RepID=A0ABS3T3R1_9FLAO|nr:O-antigen ligase family protein [Winogradskyella sp. DF17]MBO3116904.1 O-antigen ligase family protein [Winogradskyella sp. DF17]